MEPRRNLELTILSADDLTKVGFLSKSLKPYVVVSLVDHSTSSPRYYNNQTTPVDKTGNKNPTWNFRKKFALNDAALLSNRISVILKVYSRHTFLPDTLIGKVHLSAFDLFSCGQSSSSETQSSYEIRGKRTGKPKGIIKLSYKFGDVYQAPQKVVSSNNSMASGTDSIVPMVLIATMAMMSVASM